jgi:hypothetical protein
MKRACRIDSRSLWLATLIYLALPVAIFAVGWLKLPFALVLLAALVVGIFFNGKHHKESPVSMPLWGLLVLSASCVALCILAGVGGFAYQDGDYSKHNSILTDLFRREWPVAYSLEQNGSTHPVALVYYIAYYLPPACIGKFAGWEALRCAMVLWTACGLFIVSIWCLKFSRGALWAPLAFLAFGGLDMFGMILGMKLLPWMPDLWIEHRQMEWWTGFSFGNFPSHSNHLFWAPQHALPGWLIAAAVLDRIRTGTLGGCLFLFSLAVLWSPLVTIGMLPLGLAGLLVTRGKGSFDRSNLVAVPVLVVMGIFFAARGVPELPFPLVALGWNDLVPHKLVATFALEVLPWGLLLLIPSQTPKSDRLIILSSVLFLAVLPLWQLGYFNDLMMRTSLPAFSVLSFLALQMFGNASLLWRRAGAAILVAGSGGFVFDMVRHVEFLGSRSTQTDFSSPTKVPTLPATPDLAGLLGQYLGTPSSAFFRKLARPLPAVPDPTACNLATPPPGAIAFQDRMQKDLRHRFEKGERTLPFLRQYATVSYIQSAYWECLLALETIIKLDPGDPNVRIELATVLSNSRVKAYRERALHELETARQLAQDPELFDQVTGNLRKSLESQQ